MCVVRDQPDGTYTCLACRVLGTPIRECTHRQSLGMCRNRANHRSDIIYFRNTGVSTINGCGFCKWAKEYPPPPGTAPSNNQGWPGCCRAPRPEDAPLIDKEHYTAILAAWDQRALPQSVSTIRTAPAQRRSPIPQFSEPLPQPSRTPPLSSATPRRTDSVRREREDIGRRDRDERYNSRRQGSFEAPAPAPRDPPTRHSTIRTNPVSGRPSNGMIPPPPSEPLNLSSLATSLSTMQVSKAMSDSGSESSNTTIGTDSTDYLSDESEEELQRLAVARAMAIERQRAEDAEYESARRGLRDIDVTTPIQWGMNGNGGGGGTNPSVRSMQYLSFGDMSQYNNRRQR